jgi:hypothetical protein
VNIEEADSPVPPEPVTPKPMRYNYGIIEILNK